LLGDQLSLEDGDGTGSGTTGYPDDGTAGAADEVCIAGAETVGTTMVTEEEAGRICWELGVVGGET
jgi:hypothetical protein